MDVMLLVGGPCDGRRVEIDGRPRVYYLPRTNQIDMSRLPPSNEVEEGFMNVVYEEYVRAEECVYVHVSVYNKDLISLLVAGYRPEIGL